MFFTELATGRLEFTLLPTERDRLARYRHATDWSSVRLLYGGDVLGANEANLLVLALLLDVIV